MNNFNVLIYYFFAILLAAIPNQAADSINPMQEFQNAGSSSAKFKLSARTVMMKTASNSTEDNVRFGDDGKRAEVYYGGQWGTICDDDFDQKDASVFCKTLGYDTGFALSPTMVTDGTLPIIADNLACEGNEANFLNCDATWGSHDDQGYDQINCLHDEDVGVQCENLGESCTGENPYSSSCCDGGDCGVGGGDCDKNEHCSADLRCGTDNCRMFHPTWSAGADCCTISNCDGSLGYGKLWTSDYLKGCCSRDKPCSLGGGDCDIDADCHGDLTCGTDNCDWKRGWPTGADCCEAEEEEP